MDTHITATELAKSLSDVLNRVKYRDERFIIERNGEPVAEIGPVQSLPKGLTLAELVERLGHVDLPGEGFGDDLARIRAGQGMPRDPWLS